MAAPETSAPTTSPTTPPTPPTQDPAAVPTPTPGAPVTVPRVLTNFRHGGHVNAEDVAKVDPGCHDEQPSWAEVKRNSTPFGYLLDDLRDDYPQAHLPADQPARVVTALKALGTAMVEPPGRPDPADDADVAPVYTYWGQFVDHDLTANTDRDDDIDIVDEPFEPLRPREVLRSLRNLRQPALNLDSVYGNGPDHSGEPDQVPYEPGGRLRLDDTVPVGQQVIPGKDLPRKGADARDEQDRLVPLIGDRRNDENLIVAQLHVAFLQFHNAVLDWFAANPEHQVTGDGGFGRARQLVEWHYQWITVHDFLKTVADPATVDGLLDGSIVPRFGIGTTTPPDQVFMPLEFSVAAFRFGHSMVRGAYDWNENFGHPAPENPPPDAPPALATFEDLFRFTGNGGMRGLPGLPDNWPARFDRLTTIPEQPLPRVPPRRARKIDTRLAPPLAHLLNEGNAETSRRIVRILKRLAVRNLLRGYRLAMPTGQAVARSLGITPLTPDELLSGSGTPSPVDEALVDGCFLDATPLWFYVLREAEVLGRKAGDPNGSGGHRLGPVGSRIVAETIIGQLRADSSSFIGQGWTPAQGVRLGGPDGPEVDTITRFLQFAGVHP
jgi:heme peroxidase